MKLNRKVVSALALITLGVAVGGAGTFAKYTSQVDVTSGTARLAKYSFNKTEELDLFATSYDGTVQGADLDEDSFADKVVAPGTTATAEIKFKSNSEVKTETVVNLTKVEAEGVLLDHIKVEVSIDGVPAAYETLRTINDAIESKKEVSLGMPVPTDAATEGTITVPVKWEYVFEDDVAYDIADTDAASGDTLPTVKLTFTGINTQID